MKKIILLLLPLIIGCGSGDKSISSNIYDLDNRGVPKFVSTDFTTLDKIKAISKFRSAYGHDYSDNTENCRSMKHYYAPKDTYKHNGDIKIFSPIDGKIDSIINEGHGSSAGLTNKQIRIRSSEYPAFTFVLFHCDLLNSNIKIGKSVFKGELIAYARMVYPDLNEVANDFDIAVWVNTKNGVRYVSYINTLTNQLFNSYQLRGVNNREDLIISKDARDADPLTCNNQTFTSSGSISNWVNLN